MRTAEILVRGSLLRVFNFFANALVAFFLMPFIIHSLGNRMYGLWAVAGSFTGFYYLFDFGLMLAVQRYLSKAIGKKDYDEANTIINTTFYIFSIIGVLIVIVSGIIAFIVPLFVNNITEITLFRQVILILGFNFAISFPMRVLSGILISHLRYDLSTYVEISKLLLRTILIVIFLKKGHGVLSLAVITFVVELVRYGLIFLYVQSIAKYIKWSRLLIDKRRIIELFKYSSLAFIAKIADNLRFDIDNFVISSFVGLNFVTVYSIASNLIRYFINFTNSAIGLMLPIFSQYESKGDYHSIREKFLFVTKLSSYISVSIGGVLIVFGKVFIERWMGEAFLSAYPLLVVMVVAVIFSMMQAPSIQLLYGISKHKFFTLSNSIEGIFNLILSLVLVRKFGLMGVALGTAIPMAIIKLFLQPVFVCRIIGISIWKYYAEIIIPIFVKSSITNILFWYICKPFILPDYLNIVSLIVCELLILTIIFFIDLDNVERIYIKNKVFSFR